MKHSRYNIIFFIILSISIIGCGRNQEKVSEQNTLELNKNSVTAFARQLESSILNGIPDFYNQAFDVEHIRQTISNNSIVYSSLDTDFGKSFFDTCFHQGDYAVNIINDGGDFKFVKYYEKEGKHHIVIRTYKDFTLNFYDYQIDTVHNELKIKDGYIYNSSCTFSKYVEESVLLNVLYKTNPEGIVKTLDEVHSLMQNDQNQKAITLLNDHREELKDLSLYWQLYIANLYKVTSKNKFIEALNSIDNDQLDSTYFMLHHLMFYFNEGMCKETENTINQLISHTGDDPIYLLFFGKANYYAKNYKDALICYQTAEEVIPLIWDLWFGELECYYRLNDKDNFYKTIQLSESKYNMTKVEQQELIKKHFPKMKK